MPVCHQRPFGSCGILPMTCYVYYNNKNNTLLHVMYFAWKTVAHVDHPTSPPVVLHLHILPKLLTVVYHSQKKSLKPAKTYIFHRSLIFHRSHFK